MKKKLAILFILFLPLLLSAQSDTSFRLLKMVQGDFIDFSVDNLDNMYVLTSRNQVKKFNSNEIRRHLQ
jgi:hypothetical protein